MQTLLERTETAVDAKDCLPRTNCSSFMNIAPCDIPGISVETDLISALDHLG